MELQIIDLTKAYHKGIKALDGFSFTFSEGIYGLLGPNGAGKSTLLNLLTDNLSPTGGKIILNGQDIQLQGKNYRKKFGYMPQQQGLYPEFTLEDFLYYMAALKGIKKAEAKQQIPELIKKVNLQDSAGKKLGAFSGGMKQRALIAQALLGEPELIILDEPTAGLDPKERIRIRNLISEIAFHRIVIIATHVVSDIEFIAKNVILLKKGRLEASAAPVQLCQSLQGKVFEVHCAEADWETICGGYTVSNLTKQEDFVCVRIVSKEQPEIEGIIEVPPVLEDVYLYYFDEEAAYESGIQRI